MNDDTALQLQQFRTALEMLGIDFCPQCGEPQNTRSPSVESGDSRHHISLSARDGFKTFCASRHKNCAAVWLDRNRAGIESAKLGRGLAFWIIETGAYLPDSDLNALARDFARDYDLRFDLLMARHAKTMAGEAHGRTDKELLGMLGYRWDIEASRLRDQMLDFIEDVRDGKRPSRPSVFIERKAA